MNDQTQHRERAVRELAKRLRPRLVAGVDADEIARQFIADLIAEHWRCIPPAPLLAAARTVDPSTAADTAHRGAELARQLLADAGLDAP